MSAERERTVPVHQRPDAWSAGESAENGEIIATEPCDVEQNDGAVEVQEGGDVLGMRTESASSTNDDG